MEHFLRVDYINKDYFFISKFNMGVAIGLYSAKPSITLIGTYKDQTLSEIRARLVGYEEF